MKLRTLCVPDMMMRILVSGFAVTLAAAPVRAEVWTFETPSENIQCTVGEEAGIESDITCTIIEKSGSFALPRPNGCNADWGHTFSMREKGPVEILCTKTSTSRDGYSRADYGVTGEFGGFRCESMTKGLKCTNRDGNGFFLSRKLQRVFYGSGDAESSHGSESAASTPVEGLAQEVTDLSYGQARSIILDRGWKPLVHPEPGNLQFVARTMYEQGYVEVNVCSPVADAPCIFYFTNAGGRYLKVSTNGEVPYVAKVTVLKAEEFSDTARFR